MALVVFSLLLNTATVGASLWVEPDGRAKEDLTIVGEFRERDESFARKPCGLTMTRGVSAALTALAAEIGVPSLCGVFDFNAGLVKRFEMPALELHLLLAPDVFDRACNLFRSDGELFLTFAAVYPGDEEYVSPEQVDTSRPNRLPIVSFSLGWERDPRARPQP